MENEYYLSRKEFVGGYIEYRTMITPELVDYINADLKVILKNYSPIPQITAQDLIDLYNDNYCSKMDKEYDFFYTAYDWEGTDYVSYKQTLGEYVADILNDKLWETTDVSKYLETEEIIDELERF